MAELKTKPTGASVSEFLDKIPDEQRRRDCAEVVKIMKRLTKSPPRMWGSSIVGFGSRQLKYPSGRELDWFVMGFSPRKTDLTFYLPLPGGFDKNKPLMGKLGKYKTGKYCLYVKRLADVDVKVLTSLIERAAKDPASP
jgi:hypothetical protein